MVSGSVGWMVGLRVWGERGGELGGERPPILLK